MCLYVQFWFVKNQTVVQIPHYNHVLHKKKHHVRKLHKKCTFLSCYTYTLTAQVYIITMSHIQSTETNLQAYHVTHPK